MNRPARGRRPLKFAKTLRPTEETQQPRTNSTTWPQISPPSRPRTGFFFFFLSAHERVVRVNTNRILQQQQPKTHTETHRSRDIRGRIQTAGEGGREGGRELMNENNRRGGKGVCSSGERRKHTGTERHQTHRAGFHRRRLDVFMHFILFLF